VVESIPMRRAQVLSWCLYDFAGSSYSAVIAAVLFPVYYTTQVVGAQAVGELWWGRAVSLSMLVVALSSPFMGALADTRGLRKHFLVLYTLVCVAAVASLVLLGPGDVLLGFFLIVVANIGMEGGFVFYNSFLPLIAPRGHLGRVSSWGYALGYLGSVLSLLLALALMQRGLYRPVWPLVGLFFLVFSLPAFFLLPSAGGRAEAPVLETLKALWQDPKSRRFLLAFFFYQDGVNTVIVFSSIFAATVLGFEAQELVALYLLVQLSALTGAMAMARAVDTWGAKKVVLLSLALWCMVSVGAYLVKDKGAFFALATVAGLGLGSVQAASRALFARLIPPGTEAEHFGAYALMGKTSSVLGPWMFGWIVALAGSARPAVLAVGGFFLLGAALLAPLKEP